MNPEIKLISDPNSEALEFTLSGVNVSIANAVRRTILSDIPILVFKTSPSDKNKANIINNTSRLNNEIIKQRLSCIPIHIKDIENFPYKNYQVEVNVENNTDSVLYVTTEDFKIKDLTTNKYLPEENVKDIFPANDYTGDYIDFVRLLPKTCEERPGEKLNMTCSFDISTAKDDGCFNVVSTCSYGFTVDEVLQEQTLEKKRQTWKDEGKTQDEIKFESKNWKLLDGKRITKKDSFDFIIQTIGIHSNYELAIIACQLLINKLKELDTMLESDEIKIIRSQNTMANSYDITLENEDYTIGKVIEYFLYSKFFEQKLMTYCGFKKLHPHDNYSIIRVAYPNPVEMSAIKGNLKESITDSIVSFDRIKKQFTKFVKI